MLTTLAVTASNATDSNPLTSNPISVVIALLDPPLNVSVVIFKLL